MCVVYLVFDITLCVLCHNLLDYGCYYSNMEHMMQQIMVDTGIELDRQILLTHDGCLVARSYNPNNAAATVNNNNLSVLMLLY